MEIVKKEILNKVHQYRYHSFICSLLKNNEQIRTMMLERLFTFYDLERTEISNEYAYQNDRTIRHTLNIYCKDGYEREYDLWINDIFEDLVIFLSVRDKGEIKVDKMDLKAQFNMYIISDSKDDVFDKYIVKDTDVKKIVYINKEDLSMSDLNLLEFHFTVQLDCINEVKVKDDFDHFMYLLKNNKPYDENHWVYKEVERMHKEYLNSEEYKKALEYEKKRLLELTTSNIS